MPSSIGELNERSLHRALKQRYAARGGSVETAIDGYVADVLQGDRIVEIQTGPFAPLRRKLPSLLAQHPVTLVHPIARDRYIVRLPHAPSEGFDADTPPPRRKSPKHGSLFDVFSALTSIPTLLEHPNLTLDVVIVIEEEIRAPYQGRRRRRRDWVSVDRRLLEVIETHTLRSMADLFARVAEGLPEVFTSRHLSQVMQSPLRLAQQAAFCFRQAGQSDVCGKDGRFLLYRRRDTPPSADAFDARPGR